jgi:branched-chain amino acid transport system permease protein
MDKKKRALILALIIVLFLVPLVTTGPYQLHILIMMGIAVMLSSSLRLIFNSGQLSLGHGGMMTLGAYTTALLTTKLGLSTWIALAAGGVAGALLALLVGYPFMRLKGIYFSLVTVFLAEVIRLIAEQWRSLTGGSMGISNIPPPDAITVTRLFSITFTSKMGFYYLTLILVLATLTALYALERSRIGLTWFSVRESDSLAESIGVDTISSKVLAFCIGSFFAGLAGGLYCQYNSIITPSAFGFAYAMYVLIYMIVGGSLKFSGPVIGAVVLALLPEVARPLKEFQPYIFGGVVILVMFFLPGGMVSLPGRLKASLRRHNDNA